MNVFLMAVAGVWGVSALAVVTIFAVDERAHRRRQAAEPIAVEPVVTDRRPPPSVDDDIDPDNFDETRGTP